LLTRSDRTSRNAGGDEAGDPHLRRSQQAPQSKPRSRERIKDRIPALASRRTPRLDRGLRRGQADKTVSSRFAEVLIDALLG
jgi:hypothetical protein